jgi:hypothetical protein
MAISSEHPDYVERHPDWVIMRDTNAGQRKIKEKTVVYLPPTSGMVIDGLYSGNDKAAGVAAYNAYLSRAVFPNAVEDAVKVLVGALHRKPAKIELPAALEPMRKSATRKGISLDNLLRQINEQQLLTGRFGMLADVATGRDVPHLVTYDAETIINWDDENPAPFGVDKLQMVVLKETVPTRGDDMFEWKSETRYRVLLLQADFEQGEPGPAKYQTLTMVEEDGVEADPEDSITPHFKGRTLDEIPFVIIGANDLDVSPDSIPLLGLANYSLVVYRGEADFRSTLFMLGQDTLVVIGEETGEDDEPAKQTRVGVGAKISLPAQPGADAKFIGVNSDGLPEQRHALVDDHTKLREMGSRLLEPRSGQAESGEALKVRVAAQTSTLLQTAVTAAAGLEQILRVCATWVGADPEQVKVIPNLDFAETKARTSELRDLLDAREKGAPLSYESIHAWAKANGFTDIEFEEEVAKLKAEKELNELLKPTPPEPTVAPGGGPPKPGQKPATDSNTNAQ